MMMKMSLTKDELLNYLAKQLDVFFPDGTPLDRDGLARHLPIVLERMEFCFSRIGNRYFFDGSSVLFNHLHADQYAMFLYLTSHALYRGGADVRTCDKIFHLNRLLHGIDAFYEVDLPDIFLFVHPLGTVLGRGRYADYFLVYQRCGIGSNRNIYPTLDRFVTLRPGSSILGNCHIGENCTMAAGACILDRDLEANSVYMGNPMNHRIRGKNEKPAIWRI